MQSQASKKAIIIGGGLGGVTAAIALKRAGLDVTVCEQAEELLEVESGLPLWTNALRALHIIGLTDDLEKLGVQVTSVRVTTWNGDTLTDTRNDKHLKNSVRLLLSCIEQNCSRFYSKRSEKTTYSWE